MSSTTLPPIVLAFSAADPTGGAGVQADLLTLAAMGCHALSVITAITVQDTAGVENMQAVDPEWVVDQARLVLEDMPVAAFKVGMVGSIENIAAIAEVVVRSDSWERLPGSYRGSGCTLAAAIAATLANGLELPEAVREAQEYTWQTLNAGFRPGMGQYIPDRFFWAREMDEPGTGKA